MSKGRVLVWGSKRDRLRKNSRSLTTLSELSSDVFPFQGYNSVSF